MIHTLKLKHGISSAVKSVEDDKKHAVKKSQKMNVTNLTFELWNKSVVTRYHRLTDKIVLTGTGCGK